MKKKQNTSASKKNAVKRKSSIIFLQLGLVFALLLTYVALESKTIIKPENAQGPIGNQYDTDDLLIPDTTPEPPKELPKAKPIPEPDFTKIEIIKNKSDETETDFNPDIFKEDKPVTSFNWKDLPETNIDEEDPEDVPLIQVEEMPVFPGCTGDKAALQKCLSQKIGKIVAKNFDAEIAQDLGLSPGNKRIFVLFTIDKNGNITNIKTKAPHKRLREEAERVLHKIPQMKPGKFNGKKVGVKYNMSIKYQVLAD